MARQVKVLGPGCPKCQQLLENVVKAGEELRVNFTLEKVTDLKEIVAHGVIKTPGLIVDGKLVSQGKVLSVEELKEILKA